MAFDVIILGGGIIGSTAAYHLASRGLSVALVDDGRGGATAAAAGMLSPSFEIAHEKPEPAYAELLRAGLDHWDAFARELSDDPFTAFGYRRDGVYGAGFGDTPSGTEIFAGTPSFAAFRQPPSLMAPGEGAVEPLPLRALLRDRAREAGAKVLEGSAIRKAGPSLEVEGQVLTAGTLIITSGATPGADITPVRGQALLLRLAPEDKDAVPAVLRTPHVYFCPRRDDLVYLGATEEWPGKEVSRSIDDIEREALRLLPCIERAVIVRRFDAFRPFVSRRGPRVDWADEGVLFALGHHRNGVLLAPWTARRLGELIGL